MWLRPVTAETLAVPYGASSSPLAAVTDQNPSTTAPREGPARRRRGAPRTCRVLSASLRVRRRDCSGTGLGSGNLVPVLRVEEWGASLLSQRARRVTGHCFRRSVAGVVVALLAASLSLIGAGGAAASVVCEQRSTPATVTVGTATEVAPTADVHLVGWPLELPPDGQEPPEDHHHHVDVELVSGVSENRASASPRSSAAVPDADLLAPDPPALLRSARPD